MASISTPRASTRTPRTNSSSGSELPRNGLTRDSAINLALALNQLGKFDEAFKILEYVEQRWPRFYVEYPPSCGSWATGPCALASGIGARGYYMTYYNLNPRSEDAGTGTARIGDAYVRTGLKSAARGVYDKVLADFPKGDAALIAKLRLAEEGILRRSDHGADVRGLQPTLQRPARRGVQSHRQGAAGQPPGPHGPAQAGHVGKLFNRKYGDAIQAAQDFVKKFPTTRWSRRPRKWACAPSTTT